MIERKRHEESFPYFEQLNGLRFIGALSVFLFHSVTLGREHWEGFTESYYWTVFSKILGKGHHGVALFFVLSGFLITYLLLHEAKVHGRINPTRFFMRRLLRIWPLYFLVVIFGFFIFPHLPGGISTTNSISYYAGFLSNFEEIRNGWQDPVSFLSVTWSVSIEEQFYLSWVALIALLPFFARGKYFNYYFILLLVSSLVFRFVYMDSERMIYFHTLSVISDLAIGGLLAWRAFHFGIPDWFRQLARWKIGLIYVLGIGCILGDTFLFRGSFLVAERLILGLFFAFVIAEQVYCERSIFKADRLPGFKKLGDISYGWYMYHCIVIYFVQKMLVEMGWINSFFNFTCFVIASFLITYLISWSSYRFVEEPLLRLKKYFRD